MRRFSVVSLVAAAVVAVTAVVPRFAADATLLSTDKLYAYVESGIVRGKLTANAAYSVDVLRGGVVKVSASGKTAADGTYSANVPWHDGIGEGLHKGDVVKVVDKAAGNTYKQTIALAGSLDEHTGKFRAVTLPGAKVTATLYKVFAHGKVVGQKTVTADSKGAVFIDWSTLHTASPSATGPAWRGYDVDLVSRKTTNQAQQRELSTPSPTLANTLNQGGGGNFMPGDSVVTELWRDGVLRDSKATTVNADGIPRVTFSVDVGPGDMMRTRYHDAGGAERAIDIAPWTLTAKVDLAAKTISGVAAPNVPVAAIVKNPGGENLVKSTASADGTYTLQFATMAADRQVSVWRVADPGNTGVAVQQQLMHTPVIRVDEVTSEVSGYGAHGLNNAVVEVVRNGATVFSKSVPTTKAGKYRAELKTEILDTDAVRVTTGSTVLGPLPMGGGRLTMASTGNNRLAGTATPGRRVMVGRTGCEATAVAAADGSWEATPSGCTLAATDWVVVLEEETAGPSVGSWRGRFQWVTSPAVVLTSPTPGERVASTFTFTADAFDADDDAAPASVRFYVDGVLVHTDSTAPFSYTAALPAGAHTIIADAVDAGLRLDAAGQTIAGTTPARYFRV